ncbi:MAG: hypothetical protein II724_04740 [Clostridia bacterium]|nr:hypothetical protein [Clostridia bacterium]
MAAIKNGIKSILRTPVKTALFLLISTVLAALLAVAFSVFSSVRGYLRDCDDFYRTIVDLEYVGVNYPDGDVYDEALARAVAGSQSELDALSADRNVYSFEKASPSLALISGFTRQDNLSFDPEAAVLIVRGMSYYDAGSAYTGEIVRQLYSRKQVERKLVLFRFEPAEDGSEPVPESGRDYVLTGHFFSGQNSYLWFLAEDASYDDGTGVHTVPAMTELGEDGSVPVLQQQYAERLAQLNNSVHVLSTASLEDALPFHQQQLMISEGRSFTAEEYASRAKVCVISGMIAAMMEVGVGDRLDLALYDCEGDVYNAFTGGPAETGEYEIVGVYGLNSDHPYRIYVPDAGAANGRIEAGNGYRIGQFRIKNGTAAAFLEKTRGLAEKGFRFTVYDQGYSAATEPMRELQFISVVFLAICLVLAAAALALQCHLFVSRQRDAAATMLALGSGKEHVLAYFITAALMLAVPAVIAGCLIGRALEGRVLDMLRDLASRSAEADLRFSSSRMTFMKSLEFDPKVGIRVYLSAAAALLGGSALMTLISASSAMKDRETAKKRRKVTEKTPKLAAGRSSGLSGRLKYAVLSIRRNRVRTLAVLTLCLIAALFFLRLTHSLESYESGLEAVKRDTVIKGHATDRTGRFVEGLAVGRRLFDSVRSSGVISSWNVSREVVHVRFEGVSRSADGTEHELPEPFVPAGSFAQETLMGKLASEPRLVQTYRVAESPAFYYGSGEVRWLEGWDEERFNASVSALYEPGAVIPVALPASFMEKNGIDLGSTVRFFYGMNSSWEGASFDTFDALAAASYSSPNDGETVYCALYLGEQDEAGGPYHNSPATFSSLTFTLDDTSRLPALRDALEDAGFTWPLSGSRGRGVAVIDDEVYLDTVSSMERQIEYVSALYVGLYALAGIVGAVLSWLLIHSRRSEIALMRALGTQKTRIVLSCMFEAALLALLGLALGVGIHYLISGAPTRDALCLIAAFFALWCLSAFVCLIVTLSKPTMASLSEPE